jgi:hypothetical protein
MKPEEIKPGLKVCIIVKGVPFCNTVVTQYPINNRDKNLCYLRGVDEPFPISDLKPFTTGLIK